MKRRMEILTSNRLPTTTALTHAIMFKKEQDAIWAEHRLPRSEEDPTERTPLRPQQRPSESDVRDEPMSEEEP